MAVTGAKLLHFASILQL